MSFQFHTFGCKVNTYDTGLVQKNLREQGSESKVNVRSQVHILNTCAVTAEASKEAVKLVRRIRAKDPLATVVVTGCAAQVDTDLFSDLPGVDLVVANSHKASLPQLLEKHFKGQLQDRVFKSNIFRQEDLGTGGGLEEKHSRAFLKIQDGCNSFCTFCIIPYARGKSRSIPILQLVQRVRELSQLGYQEVVLTGVHIGDYADEEFPGRTRTLEDLVEAMLSLTNMPRFRLTSLEPIEVTSRLLDLYSNPRLCPHFHMSIQSGCTSVLKAMKRKYGEDEVRRSLDEIQTRVPGAFVGMDVIAGFPTETEVEFEETFKTLNESKWTRLHVFPYSERSGTRAATLPQLSMSVRKARARRLRELSLVRFQEKARAQFGTLKPSLLLKKVVGESDDFVIHPAVSRDYWTTHVKVPRNLPATLHEIPVRIVDLDPNLQMEGVLQGVYEPS